MVAIIYFLKLEMISVRIFYFPLPSHDKTGFIKKNFKIVLKSALELELDKKAS